MQYISKLIALLLALLCLSCSDSGSKSIYSDMDSVSIAGHADRSITIPDNITIYRWPYSEGPYSNTFIDSFGRPDSISIVEYEHCFFNKNDTVKVFYNTYLRHPETDYYKLIWNNVDSTGEDLVLYSAMDNNDNDRCFWGYRCRPEDFTTDIYKVE